MRGGHNAFAQSHLMREHKRKHPPFPSTSDAHRHSHARTNMQTHTVTQGVLHVSLRNPREAVVQVGSTVANSALGRLVRVSGRLAMNRALHRDTVAGECGVDPHKRRGLKQGVFLALLCCLPVDHPHLTHPVQPCMPTHTQSGCCPKPLLHPHSHKPLPMGMVM